MSLLTNQIASNKNKYYFLLADVSTLTANSISTGSLRAGVASIDYANVSTLNASTVSTTVLECVDGLFSTLSTGYADIYDLNTSSIFANTVVLDTQVLTATPQELLLNGVPLVVTSNLSSIADWSLDPAISTVNMNGNNLINANTIVSSNAMFQNLMVQNVFAVSTYTSTVSSLAEVADYGFFNNLFATSANLSNLSAGTFYADSATFSTLAANTGTFSTLATDSASFSTLVSPVVSTQALFVSSINNNELTTSSITVSSMVTQVISSVFLQASSISGTFVSTLGAEIRQGLMSSIVFSPSLNPSLGGVNVNLGLGGILGNVIGWGAGVLGAATGVVALGTSIAALATGRQTNYIDNTKYELVNGTTQLQFSTLGDYFSTIYRFNNSPDPERIPGEEVFISTVYAPQLAVRSLSDPMFTLSTPNSSIQSFGQWVPVPEELLTSSFSTLAVANLTANRITTSSIVGGEASLLTIGAPLIHLSTAAVGGLVYTDGEMDALRFESRDVWTSSIQTSSITTSSIQAVDMVTQNFNAAQVSTSIVNAYNITSYDISTAVVLGANPGAFSLELRARPGGTFYLNGQGATIAGATVTSSLNADGVVGNYGLLGIVSTATILGANSNLFGIGVQGLELRTTPAGQIWVSSPQTNIAGFINSSTIGANRVYSGLGEFSTLNMTGLSTVTFSTLGTAGAQGQPAGRLGLFGNDLDAGNQDIWCNQIRVGAGQASAPGTAEVTFYDVTGLRVKGLLTGTSDTTIRISDSSVPGVNSPGYLLDTRINPPFFSTINNQVNLVASFPSTSANTIGFSTISKMNPVTLYGRSTLAGGTVTVVFSPPYADSNEYCVYLTYKDTAGGSPMHANILSISSFSANGSATNSFFWQTIGRV